MKRVLFVCIENSCRSQMAEAFARMYGAGIVEAYSAGSRPSGVVNMKAIRSMAEVGYDLTTHRSKSLNDLPWKEFDILVTMGCGDECPLVAAGMREEWNIPDPRDLSEGEFDKVRDMIREKVLSLLKAIKEK